MPMARRDTPPFLEDSVRYTAHWTIFLPTIIVALLYGSFWLVLIILDKGDTALARMLLLVVVLVVPVLLVRSYLRYVSLGLLVGKNAIVYRRGWLRPRWRRVHMNSLSAVRPVISPLGSLFGGGALIITRMDHGDIRLYDMSDPEGAAMEISRRLRAVTAGKTAA